MKEIRLGKFSVFCPRALAGIGNLPRTVADRSLPIRLKRRLRSEKVERFRFRDVGPEAEALRRLIEAWALGAVDVLRESRPELPETLDDRQADGVEPLLAIADYAGGEWPKRARRAIEEVCNGEATDDASTGVLLLRDCRLAFQEKEIDRLASADLCSALAAFEESPWGEIHNGKPLNVRGLARLLKPYGIASRTIRLGSQATVKGYYKDSFEEAWSRYLPPAGSQSVTASQANDGGPVLDFSKSHKEEPVTAGKGEIANADGPCDGVTVETPWEGIEPSERLTSSKQAGEFFGPACLYFVGNAIRSLCARCSLPFRAHLAEFRV